MSKHIWFLIAITLTSTSLFGQIQLPKKDLKNITSARYIQRTMHLLKSSTPEKRNTVRILVYGQSLSAQDWWLEVKAHLENEYPYANLIMDNKAIGGFASQFLIKTVRRDILDFYPDLVIFHVFGSDTKYEEILFEMRSLTSTEVLIWNDPQNKPEPNPWHEKMSYQILPEFAVKYKCGFIDLRTPINETVKNQNLVYADEFTRDGLHFNEKGCALIAGQIIPHLLFNKKNNPDPDELAKTYEIGKDIKWQNGELILTFEGNRIDVVTSHKVNPESTFTITINDKKPSEISKAYNYTRPNDNGEKGWIWNVASPARIQRKADWIEETFTLTYDFINYESGYLRFHVMGSKSGFEGEGNNRKDFLSKSGRVFIEANEVNDSIPGDWHVFRTAEVTKFKVEKRYELIWRTYLMGTDVFKSTSGDDPRIENSSTLVKGLPGGKHTLKLVNLTGNTHDIEKIKVYKPLL